VKSFRKHTEMLLHSAGTSRGVIDKIPPKGYITKTG